jgi:hypothetical protein
VFVGRPPYREAREARLDGAVSDRTGVRAKLTTYKTVVYGLLIAVAGFGAMWLSNISWFAKHSALQTTVNQLGGC